MRDPVIIVGGGLAGLACAGELERRNVPYRLFEASDRVGGRVKTDDHEGFRLDRGFQVHFPAYPNAKKALAGMDLDLRPWRNGAKVWDGARLRTLDRDRPLLTLHNRVLGLPDLARLALLSVQAAGMSVEEIRNLPDSSTEEEFKRRGFSEAALRRFLRPFYGGVFVDLDLRLSRRQFLFVHKNLVAAPASIPNAGMETIPRALAAPLGSVETNAPVVALVRDSEGKVAGVRVRGETLKASQVVLAVEADAADRLRGLSVERQWLASVAIYFESESPACDGAYIVLNGTGEGLVTEVVPVTNCAKGYAPKGRHLLCAVVIGDPQLPDDTLVERARKEVLTWCPNAGALKFLRLYRVRQHQLPQPPGFRQLYPDDPTALNLEKPEDLILAGEVAMNCSIDGAIASGLRAAEQVPA